MKDMFETLCKTKKVPDLEFFINRRDFPIIKKDGTEPYNHIYNSENHKLVSHNYNKYSPILSMTTTDKHSDIPIPTGDDWSRISFRENKFFPKHCRDYSDEFKYEWSAKKSVAVFRGSSTGSGVDINTNMRLKLAYLSYTHNLKNSKNPKNIILNAGITKFNLRPRKIMGEKYLKTIDVKKIGIKLVKPLTPNEQSKYKYIINVPGHVSAFRLSLELSMGCCILLVGSKYKLWFTGMLKPYVHYVPVKEDLSDLISQIEWCRKNDDKCEKMAQESSFFYTKYLLKDGILDYLQKLVIDLKKSTGLYFYSSKSLFELQLEREIKIIIKNQKIHPKYREEKYTTLVDKINIINNKRIYGLLKGLRWIVNIKKGVEVYKNNSQIIYENCTRTVCVKKSTLLNYQISIKKSKTKENENTHEIFVGIKCINKLLKYIPNFSYMFGYYDETNTEEKASVIMEYIEGKTLCEWIKTEFNMKEFLFILIQICLALELAQKFYGFVHWDLAPWNIIIHRTREYKTIDYMLNTRDIFKIKTNIIPVIIDYGKSHVIYKNYHYGYIHMYKTSTIQDVISLLLNSLYDISLNSRLTGYNINEIILLSNFLTGNKYMKKIYKTGKMGMGGLRYLYGKEKKYSQLINSNKHELEQMKPINLILYIKKNFNYTFNFKQISNPILNFVDNSIQELDYIFAQTKEEQIKSYTDVFQRFLNCTVPKITNIILAYHMLQILYTNLSFTFEKANTDRIRLKELYDQSIKKLEKYYTDLIGIECKNDETIKRKECWEYKECKYTLDTFTYPDKIKKLIKEYESYNVYDLSEYIRIVEFVMVDNGKFKLCKKHRAYYSKNFNYKYTLNMKIQKTNIKTLVKSSYMLYKNNTKELIKGCDLENEKYKNLVKYLKQMKI